MAEYLITAPDGSKYKVSGDGSQEEALSHFQSTWKPSAREGDDYSNEGRSRPTSTNAEADALNAAMAPADLSSVGKFAKDVPVGLARLAATTGKTATTVFPTLRMLKEIGQARGYDPIGDADTGTKKLYDEAGPGATAGKVLGELALTGGASSAAGKFVGDKVAGAAPGILRKAVSRLAEGATSGASAAGALSPGEGETRLGNAVQAGVAGGVLGPVVGGIGDGVKLLRRTLTPGTRGALTRADDMFNDVLGKGRKDAVTENIRNIPRELPMSTAAAAGRQELDAMERISRRSANPVDNARWGSLDARTNRAANDKLQSAIGDDLANLQPRAEEAKSILTEAQSALNKTPLTNEARQSLSDELLSLKNTPALQLNSKAQVEINNLTGMLLDPQAKMSVGALAHLETEIAGSSLAPPVKKQLWETVRKHIDANGGGSWSEAYNIRNEALDALKQSQAANNIAGDFNSAYGGAKGKVAPSGEAAVGSARLNASVNKWGETRPRDGADPENLLNPDTRESLNGLIDALRKAESPRAGSGGNVSGKTAWGNFDRAGNPTPVNNSIVNAVKIVMRKLTNDRAGGTARAADMALRSPEGWERMLKAAEKTKEISASDAAMIARILRGSAVGAGNLSTGD